LHFTGLKALGQRFDMNEQEGQWDKTNSGRRFGGVGLQERKSALDQWVGHDEGGSIGGKFSG
jgi:hypothetical protein